MWQLWAGLLLAVAASVLAVFYTTLPNRSSWFSRSSFAEASSAPQPHFRMGAVEWDVASYATDQRLQPFREEFERRCGGRRGLDAAVCISNAMARLFPHGEPPAEFIDRAFDPSAHLARHMGGAPGHCMNRSAILAAELLSVGIPARVAQLLPMGGPGHTVVEVWDARDSWVVVDPTSGAVLGDGSGPTSAGRLMQTPEVARWFALARAPAPSSLVEAVRHDGPDTRLYGGQVLYPEPWLYLRVGAKRAPWPFRGMFACVASGSLECGSMHQLLRFAIVGSALTSILLAGAVLRKRWQTFS